MYSMHAMNFTAIFCLWHFRNIHQQSPFIHTVHHPMLECYINNYAHTWHIVYIAYNKYTHTQFNHHHSILIPYVSNEKIAVNLRESWIECCVSYVLCLVSRLQHFTLFSSLSVCLTRSLTTRLYDDNAIGISHCKASSNCPKYTKQISFFLILSFSTLFIWAISLYTYIYISQRKTTHSK